MAYGRSFNGGRLLSDWNISTNYVISFVHHGEWRFEDCGLNKDSPRSAGNVRGRSYIPSPILSVGLIWIDSIWVSFSSVILSN
jgi:hypothetical protein